MENARLFESEARRVAELDTVRVLALDLTAEHDLDTLLQSIVWSRRGISAHGRRYTVP